MKALKLPSEAQHLVILEEGDRFVQLAGKESAVVLDIGDDSDIKVTVHYPLLEEGAEVPTNVLLVACVKEFLEDPALVQQVQERMKYKAENSTQEQA